MRNLERESRSSRIGGRHIPECQAGRCVRSASDHVESRCAVEFQSDEGKPVRQRGGCDPRVVDRHAGPPPGVAQRFHSTDRPRPRRPAATGGPSRSAMSSVGGDVRARPHREDTEIQLTDGDDGDRDVIRDVDDGQPVVFPDDEHRGVREHRHEKSSVVPDSSSRSSSVGAGAAATPSTAAMSTFRGTVRGRASSGPTRTTGRPPTVTVNDSPYFDAAKVRRDVVAKPRDAVVVMLRAQHYCHSADWISRRGSR